MMSKGHQETFSVTFLQSSENSDEIYVGVAGSFGKKEEHQEWMEMAQEMFPWEDVKYDPLTFSISCHVGPGAFGMGISRKIRI